MGLKGKGYFRLLESRSVKWKIRKVLKASS